MQTPSPLSKELAPHEVLDTDGVLDPDELDELDDPELDVVVVEDEEVELDPVEAEEDEEDVELEVEVEVVVDEPVEVEVDGWDTVTAGVSLQGLLGKAMYEGIPDGIAGT